MNNVYLLTGGNVGDRLNHLQACASIIEEECGSIISRSAVYETEPWGKADQPRFLNQVLLLSTTLSPFELIEKILAIEQRMGRVRNEKYAQRVIDVDILFFNDQVIQGRNLTVPHPEIARRRFALEPLYEIAPTLVHPVLRRTIGELLQECTDQLAVKKL